MSSGSNETILGVVVLAVSVTYVAGLAARRATARPQTPSEPVHLGVPPPADPPRTLVDPRVLRVCADPNNLPFSNREGAGFENRIAEIVARDLGRRVEYYWQPQRRGFIRTTLDAGRCDLVMGLAAGTDMARVTRPYYRSSYVFVSRHDRHLTISSIDDPRLRSIRIGIPVTGEDYDNPPPAQALANRHIVDNVRGYTVYGDYSQPHPSWGVLEAVLDGDVDIAIAWGPVAGYAAQRTGAPVRVVAVNAPTDPRLPFAFDIAMGVRRGDAPLARALNGVIAKRAFEIRRILASYGVPLAEPRKGLQG